MIKSLLVLVLILLPAACLASDSIDDSIKAIRPRMTSDDFDEREKATGEMGNLPADACAKVIAIYWTEQDPEIKWRLYVAAIKIFDQKILTIDPVWRRINAYSGLDLQAVMIWKRQASNYTIGTRSWNVIGVMPAGPADDKLKENDKIVEVDGKSVPSLLEEPNDFFLCNQEYELTVWRFKDTTSDRMYVDTDEHEVLKIKLNVVLKKYLQPLEEYNLYQLRAGRWREFLADHPQPKP